MLWLCLGASQCLWFDLSLVHTLLEQCYVPHTTCSLSLFPQGDILIVDESHPLLAPPSQPPPRPPRPTPPPPGVLTLQQLQLVADAMGAAAAGGPGGFVTAQQAAEVLLALAAQGKTQMNFLVSATCPGGWFEGEFGGRGVASQARSNSEQLSNRILLHNTAQQQKGWRVCLLFEFPRPSLNACQPLSLRAVLLACKVSRACVHRCLIPIHVNLTSIPAPFSHLQVPCLKDGQALTCCTCLWQCSVSTPR